MGSAFPFGAVGSAAPSISVDSCFRMFVECEIVEAKVDATIWTQVEFHCGKTKTVNEKNPIIDVVTVVAKGNNIKEIINEM